jgi:uncharacterized protein YndB with AHSA1/START domain
MSERPVGLTRDAGWQIGVSRTFPVSIEQAWDFLLSSSGLRLWLGEGVTTPLVQGASYRTTDGTVGEVRSLRPRDRVRITWQPPGRPRAATVQLALRPSPNGCSVRFHSERLADAEERERMRDRWRAVLDELESAMPAA